MNLKQLWHSWRAQKANPLPYVTTPYRAALEKIQRRYVVLFLMLFLMFSYYAYRYTQHKTEVEALVPVVVATGSLDFPHRLTGDDLGIIVLPQKWVPVGSWSDTSELIGQTLLRSLEPYEVVVKADVHPDLDPKSVTAKFNEAFAFTIGEDWLVAKLPSLKDGDTIDVLATNPEAGLASTLPVASGLKIISVTAVGGRKNLVVKVTQAQAQALLFTRGLRLPMQVLTHNHRGVLIKNNESE